MKRKAKGNIMLETTLARRKAEAKVGFIEYYLFPF